MLNTSSTEENRYAMHSGSMSVLQNASTVKGLRKRFIEIYPLLCSSISHFEYIIKIMKVFFDISFIQGIC